MSALAARLATHVGDTLTIALAHTREQAAIVVADERTELSRLLFQAYRTCLPHARVVCFDDVSPEAFKASFDGLGEGALAVLIQSSVFKIPDFRARAELFRRGIKVIEHANLERIAPEQLTHYVEALAYDPGYYRGVGHALKARMDVARSVQVESDGERLLFDTPLELAKLNIGDFTGFKNIGSLFPIGEVFSEARDLERVQGRVKIYAFTNTSFRLEVPSEPAILVVERGRVTNALNATEELDRVLGAIVADEGEVWLRELGFGMNRAFSRTCTVDDVGAFERVCGVHLSLGARHGVYKKPHLDPRAARHHVDTFAITDRVLLDDDVVYAAGAWR